jgi:hypothetical protein
MSTPTSSDRAGFIVPSSDTRAHLHSRAAEPCRPAYLDWAPNDGI